MIETLLRESLKQNTLQTDNNVDSIDEHKIINMKTIKFKKDGTKRIILDGKVYNPKTLEQLLNITTAFYAKVEQQDEEGNISIVDGPTTEWFNYKGLTYVKQIDHWSKNL